MRRGRGHTPIGIDVGSRQIKAVQLNRSSKGDQIRAAAILPRRGDNKPFDGEEAAQLSEMLARQGFDGRKIVLAAAAEQVMTEILELPPRNSGAPIEEIARAEMARSQRCDFNSFEMALWDLPAPARAAEGSCVMAATGPHAQSDHILDLFEAEGWEVITIDIHPWAMARSCAAAYGISTDMIAALDLGARHSLFVLIYQGVVVYDRSLNDVGIAPLHDALKSRLDLDEEMTDHILRKVGFGAEVNEQSDQDHTSSAIHSMVSEHVDRLIEELQVSLSYAAQQYPKAGIGRLALLGGGAAIPGITHYIDEALDVDVMALTPCDMVKCPSPLRAKCETPALTMAIGLAQYHA